MDMNPVLTRNRNRRIALLTAGAVAGALVLTLVARGWFSSGAQSTGIGPSVGVARAEERPASSMPVVHRQGMDPAAAVSTTLPEQDIETSKAHDQLEATQEEIRTAMEVALLGVLDPGAFMDVALLLTELEVASKPIPEPDPSGAMRYPVLGTPDGIRANLLVARTGNPKYANPVLALRFQIDAADARQRLERFPVARHFAAVLGDQSGR
jgi:hypothetical protein